MPRWATLPRQRQKCGLPCGAPTTSATSISTLFVQTSAVLGLAITNDKTIGMQPPVCLSGTFDIILMVILAITQRNTFLFNIKQYAQETGKISLRNFQTAKVAPFLKGNNMCEEKSGCYILSRVESGNVPQYLVLGWNSAVLMGSWHKTLTAYIEETYRGYVSGCVTHPPKPIEIWMQDAEHLWRETCRSAGTEWTDRRKERSVMSTSEDENP